jgi:hypothetical protein
VLRVPVEGDRERFKRAGGAAAMCFIAANFANGCSSNCGTVAGARAEDRIRCAKDTGLVNLPLHELNQNRIWCLIVALACGLNAWNQLLALTEHPARRWEPKRLRLRLFSTAGRLTRSARRTVLHLSTHAPWAHLLLQRSRPCTRCQLPADHVLNRPDNPRKPTRGTGAPPSDLGQPVVPVRQNHQPRAEPARSRSATSYPRNIWA